MQAYSGNQVASNSWVTLSAVTVDTNTGGEKLLCYYFQATVNDVMFKIQGSVNGINWIDLNTNDLLQPDMQNSIITCLSGSSAVAVIAPELNYGMNSAFRYYRTQLMGSTPYGTGYVDVFAK